MRIKGNGLIHMKDSWQFKSLKLYVLNMSLPEVCCLRLYKNFLGLVITLITFYYSPMISDMTFTALGPAQTQVPKQRQFVTCILCQEEQEVRVESRAMVLAAFVQRSTVLSKNRSKFIQDPGKS